MRKFHDRIIVIVFRITEDKFVDRKICLPIVIIMKGLEYNKQLWWIVVAIKRFTGKRALYRTACRRRGAAQDCYFGSFHHQNDVSTIFACKSKAMVDNLAIL